MNRNQKTVALHVVFWIVYTTIFTFVEGGYQNHFKEAFFLELAHLPLRLIVVYLNYFLLLPKFLEQSKYINYISYTLLSVIAASFLQRAFLHFLVNPVLFPNWLDGGLLVWYRVLQAGMLMASPLIFVIGFTLAARWVNLVKRTERLEKEKKEAELKLLKTQLNPHFFFNTLNSLYGLAQEKSDKTEQVVLKLSDLMQYMLYETDQALVPLSKEIAYIKNYIELEEIRYDNRFTCNMSLSGDTKSAMIPPVILLPFIENSFKHGINKESKDSWITIFISVEDGELDFTLENSLPKDQNLSESERPKKGGLGIKNVKKRLKLLYPGSHTLETGKAGGQYRVSLHINLNS